MTCDLMRFIQLKKDYRHTKESDPARYDLLDRLMIEAILTYGEAEGLSEEQRYAFVPQLSALVSDKSNKPGKTSSTLCNQNEERG